MSNDTGEEVAQTVYAFCERYDIVLTSEKANTFKRCPYEAAQFIVKNAQREFLPRAHGDDLVLQPVRSGEPITISRFLFRATIFAVMLLIDQRYGFHPLLPQKYADRLFDAILINSICQQKMPQTSPAETKEAGILPQEARRVQKLYPEDDGDDFY